MIRRRPRSTLFPTTTLFRSRLRALMERINEQEELLAEPSDLVPRPRPDPVGIAEQMPNVMIPQGHRGEPWAVEHARRFRDEVKRSEEHTSELQSRQYLVCRL